MPQAPARLIAGRIDGGDLQLSVFIRERQSIALVLFGRFQLFSIVSKANRCKRIVITDRKGARQARILPVFLQPFDIVLIPQLQITCPVI